MLNRRLIRVKVLQAVYAYHQSEVEDLRSARAFLRKSITGVEDTFVNVLQFADALFQFVKTKQNPLEKHLKADREELAKYRILSENRCLDLLVNTEYSGKLFRRAAHNWNRDDDFLFSIHKQISESEWLHNFLGDETEGFEKDRQFLTYLYKFLVESSDDFNTKMEEINLQWQDEKIPVLKSIEKLIKPVEEESKTVEVPLLSKDLDDDLKYSEKLLELTVENHEQCESLISSRTPEWDSERIARIDLYIMVMALNEFMEFPNIPVKVTINEYLELAKIYSTPQSSRFINGILDKLLAELKKENRIRKTGRGLVE